MVDMSVNIAGVTLKNPVTVASGCFAFGREYNEFYPISELGAVSSKGLTYQKRLGNDAPRITETPMGLLNSVGLQNPGIEDFVKYELPFMKEVGATVIANIAGKTVSEFAKMAEILDETEVDMIELNVSCPNVASGGMAFGVSCDAVSEITSLVRKSTKKPVIVKLSPNVTSVADIARAAESAGADCISLINTLLGMRININTRRPILKNNTGGLSGPAVFPVAVRMVRDVYKAVKLPIIGMGGITTAEDAVEMMIAGATAVSVGSANLADPYAAYSIVNELAEYFEKNNLKPSDITGSLIEY
ncbi:MAG: dihydroorotate dehydrogenase [Clostridia bacterium]|nr:dihydroorotate dehydrogenase [Clostridia bacterium]MBR2327455.1 dihydroorotate dehydrogenase [Clostridia bacterium]